MPILGEYNSSGGGSGDVSVSGTPVAGQMTSWTDDSTIKGETNIVNDSDVLVVGHTESVAARLGQTLETNSSAAYGGAAFATWSTTDTECPFFELNKSASNTIGTHAVVADNETVGYIQFRGSDGTNFVTSAAISCLVDGTPGANDVPGELLFYVDKNVLSFQIAADGGIFMQNLATISGQADVQYNTSTKELGYVTSSEQFKTNIRDISSSETDFVYDVLIKKYDRLDGSNINEVAPLAEDVEQYKPELCFYDENDNLLGYSNLATVPYLWKALQEQKAEIDTLKEQVTTLQTEVAALQAK